MKMTKFIESTVREEKDWRTDPTVMERFPEVSPRVLPLGARVLCQLMSVKSESGKIILVKDTKDTNQWENQVARVLAVGPLAFCNRETGQQWNEGMWAEPGDFVIVPRWNGQRRTVKVSDNHNAYMVTVNDHELVERVYGNPLDMEVVL